MNSAVRRKLEMAQRVRDFLRSHPLEGTGAAAALARFEELLARAEALGSQQLKGVVATRSATSHRRAIRRDVRKLVKYLVAVGGVAAQERAELSEQFRMPASNFPHQSFVTTVRDMLTRAEAQRELLVSKGMSETLLADLGRAVAAFEATLEASRAGRREHTGASAELKGLATQISRQVKVLDGLVRYRFEPNLEVMGSWLSARNLAGPLRPKDGLEAGGEEPSPGGLAPAA